MSQRRLFGILLLSQNFPPFSRLLTNGVATAQGGGGGKIVVNRSQIIGNVFSCKKWNTNIQRERGNWKVDPISEKL